VLNLNLNCLLAVKNLPAYHKNPFDRLLVSEAQAEKLANISADIMLDGYEIERLW